MGINPNVTQTFNSPNETKFYSCLGSVVECIAGETDPAARHEMLRALWKEASDAFPQSGADITDAYDCAQKIAPRVAAWFFLAGEWNYPLTYSQDEPPRLHPRAAQFIATLYPIADREDGQRLYHFAVALSRMLGRVDG